MMDDASTLPVPIAAGAIRVSTVAQLADIPEEQIWLSKQKSARTRRAYRLDVQQMEEAGASIIRGFGRAAGLGG